MKSKRCIWRTIEKRLRVQWENRLARKLRGQRKPAVESLESRHLLSGDPLFLSPVNNTLFITGSEFDDHVTVSVPTAGVLRVEYEIDGTEAIRDFTKANVNTISFVAHEGNDTFFNFTDVTTNVRGGEGNDYLQGGSAHDLLFGEGGSDHLVGGAGNDDLRGGSGPDILEGNAGDDLLMGEADNDHLLGGAGRDDLLGHDGDDFLEGGSEVDDLRGGDGNDQLEGGDGNDLLFGNAGSDSLYGGDGDDELRGGDGGDFLYGNDGTDVLIGENGDDRLFGGNGNDTLWGQADDDHLEGGAGNDGLRGGSGADRLIGNAGDDLLLGEAGDDVLSGEEGNDELLGGEGNDTLWGNAGIDVLIGEGGNDQIYGGDDNDTLWGYAGDDHLEGGAGDDDLRGGDGVDRLLGNEGDDLLLGGNMDDVLLGGDGEDLLIGELGDDQLFGGDGNDQLYGSVGDDLLVGDDGDDQMLGDEGNDSLFGGAGDDDLRGLEGNDLLSGEDGEDLLIGASGNDVLIGGMHVDSLDGNSGEDLLIGGRVDLSNAALDLVLEIWGSSLSYEARVDAIESEASAAALRPEETVFDDHLVDTVAGAGDRDWFFMPGANSIYDPLGNATTGGSHDHSQHGGDHHGEPILISEIPKREGFDLIDSFDNITDLQEDEVLSTLIPHARDLSKQLEHLSLFELVRYDQITHTAINDGPWSSSSTWLNGKVPTTGARVLIPVGTEIQVDGVINQAIATVRVDGELSFATDANTLLRVDTMVVSEVGKLTIGTESEPIQANVKARLQFTSNGPIDRSWDPFGISRGLITHGAVEMVGAETTSYGTVSHMLYRGSSGMRLNEIPEGWKAGDEIVFAGTSASGEDQSEVRRIQVILGGHVFFEPLLYDHNPIDDSQLVHVANLTRNIEIKSEATSIDQRGHVMFMHNRNVNIQYAGFYGMGRTDKFQPINDSEVDANWNLVPGTGTNNRARYSIHFHRNGVLADGDPSVVHGSVVVDDPGWAYVNHSSYVNFSDNIAYDITGAAYTTEVGDEIGEFRNNLAISIKGSGELVNSRESIQDFGHSGEGFWFQGANISVVDNIVSGAEGSAYFYYTRGFKINGITAHVPTESLADPSIAGGADSLLVDYVPVREFDGNVAYASSTGLTVRYHLRGAGHTQQSVIRNSTFWNNEVGVDVPYTTQTTLENLRVIHDASSMPFVGVDSNSVTGGIIYKNLTVLGYYWGIEIPRRGESEVYGGHFHAAHAIVIRPPAVGSRSVLVHGNMVFEEVSPAILGNDTQTDVNMRYETLEFMSGIDFLFNENLVVLDYNQFDNQQAYFTTQLADAIPFPEALPHVPTAYVGLTTQQIRNVYGLTIGGELAPSDATTVQGVRGLVASSN